MKNPVTRWHELSNAAKLGWTIVLAACAQLCSTGLFLYVSAHQRQENCELVVQAFDGYTDALAQVSQADEAAVAQFRATYQPLLEDCT